MRQRQTGFTLVELMVILVVISILTGIAIPSYRGYMMRTNRVDATSALLRIAASQEKFYLQANPAQYAVTPAELADPPPAGLGVGVTERGFYTLAVAANANGAGVGYMAIAIIDPGENQAADVDCALFMINELGQRTATDSNGIDNTEACWR